MRAVTVALGVLIFVGPAVGQAQDKPAPAKPASTPAAAKPEVGKPAAGGEVSVTVTYTGKVAVDDTHEIWVFLFPSPEIGPGSQPVGVQAVKKNGGVATFKNITQPVVYVAVAFDEKGDYAGDAVPPPGTPVALHTKDGVAAPVKPGGRAKMSFDDSVRLTHQ